MYILGIANIFTALFLGTSVIAVHLLVALVAHGLITTPTPGPTNSLLIRYLRLTTLALMWVIILCIVISAIILC